MIMITHSISDVGEIVSEVVNRLSISSPRVASMGKIPKPEKWTQHETAFIINEIRDES